MLFCKGSRPWEPGLNPYSPMPPFISFEGLDGCGKTTQVRLLADYLEDRGVQATVLREPGSTPVGELIRDLLLGSLSKDLDPLSELLLFYTDRNQNIQQKIIPAQAEGKWVLCDRFADASTAYQGYGKNLDLALVESLNQMVTGGKKPDLTVLIDIEPSLAVARARDRNSRSEAESRQSSQPSLPFPGVNEGRFEAEFLRSEAESLELFHRIREGYLQIAAREPRRVRVLNGSQTIQQLQKEIMSLISTFLPGGRSDGME